MKAWLKTVGLTVVVVGSASVGSGACAQGERSGTSGAGGIAWSSSSASTVAMTTTGTGGAGGLGGDASASGTGGQGGGTGGTGAAGVGGSGGGVGGSGGGAGQGFLLALAGPVMFGARFDGSKWTNSANFMPATNRAPALAILTSKLGVGVYRAENNGALTYLTEKDGVWSTAVAIDMNVTTKNAPAIAARATAAHVVFQGDDFKHYFASYAASWSPIAQKVESGASHSFGPNAGALAVVGQELVFAFPGDDGALYQQSRVNGTWQAAQKHANTDVSLTPAIVALSAGAELLVAYVAKSDKKLLFATRANGKWSAPAVVEANSYANDAPSLAALANGEAMLAFRGLEGKGYVTRYAPQNNPVWSLPVLVTAGSTIAGSPSVARGIGAADAEIVFASLSGSTSVEHRRLISGNWSNSVTLSAGGAGYAVCASTQ